MFGLPAIILAGCLFLAWPFLAAAPMLAALFGLAGVVMAIFRLR